MSLSELVQIDLNTTPPPIAQANFAKVLLLSPNAKDQVVTLESGDDADSLTNYIDGIDSDFPGKSPEGLMLQALLDQGFDAANVMIGKITDPVQRFTIAVNAGSINTGNKLSFTVYSSRSGAHAEVEYVVLAGDDNDDVVDGVKAALDAIADFADYEIDTSIQGAGGSHVLQIQSNAGGGYTRILIAPESFAFGQSHDDPGVADDLSGIAAGDASFYAVANAYNSPDMAAAIATWCESHKRLFLHDTSESLVATDALPSEDIAASLKATSTARTATMWYYDTGSFPCLRWGGVCLPFTPGSETWKFKTLSGVAPIPDIDGITSILKSKNCNYYALVAGAMTTEGVTAVGEYIDIVRGRDYLTNVLQTRVINRLRALRKIAYTDTGLALIQSELLAGLNSFTVAPDGGPGLLSLNPAPTVTVPKVSEQEETDRETRVFRNLRFSGTFAGAVHKLVIAGTLAF